MTITAQSPPTLFFPKWWTDAGLALHTIEIGQGVRVYLDELYTVRWDTDAVPSIDPIPPYSVEHDGVWYHQEEAYLQSDVCDFSRSDTVCKWPEWLKMESELSVHGPFSAAKHIDCMGMTHPQFFYWDVINQIPGVSPDAIFGKRKFSVQGTTSEISFQEAYITRDNTWFLKSYNFYVCVWMLKGIMTKDELILHRGEVIILPAVPPIIMYTHDTYSTYSEATMQSLPWGWDNAIKST